MQTDDLRAAVVEDGQRVAIADVDHSAMELQGFARAGHSEGQEQDEPRADDPVYRQRDDGRRSCIPPGTDCISGETSV
jgi:hypothetical protein